MIFLQNRNTSMTIKKKWYLFYIVFCSNHVNKNLFIIYIYTIILNLSYFCKKKYSIQNLVLQYEKQLQKYLKTAFEIIQHDFCGTKNF